MAYPAHFDSRIERKIIDRIITEALGLGYVFRIYDGEEWAVDEGTCDYELITANIAATETTILHLNHAGIFDAKRTGWIALIHGNDEDVIHDHTNNPALAHLCREWEEPAPPAHIEAAVKALEPEIFLPENSMRAVINTVLDAANTPAPEAHTTGSDDLRTVVGMLLGTIQRQRKWLKSSLARDEVIEFDNAVDAVRAAWVDTAPPQTNVIGEDHIINLIESADAISMLIGKVGNYGGKLEYRREKLRELADLLRTPSPQTRAEESRT